MGRGERAGEIVPAGEDEEKGREMRQELKTTESKTHRGRYEHVGKNRCLDLIQKPSSVLSFVLLLFSSTCADIPFESCYQVNTKNKQKCSRDKGLTRLTEK